MSQKGELTMPSYSSLKSSAQQVSHSSSDAEIKKLASAVYELARKLQSDIETLEAKVKSLEARVR